jgi:ribosomal protein S18 acetylase RimI-like enzyme
LTQFSKNHLQNVEIRNFQETDMPLLGDLFQSVTSREHAVFWWVGEEGNWKNVFCAFHHGMMIAKGQVSIINTVPPGRPADARHSIYLNLKAVPEWEQDYNLLERMYEPLFKRAKELKASLPADYETLLCVGNDAGEQANNRFFTEQKGFRHLNSLFSMSRDLALPIPELTLPAGLEMKHWKMDTSQEEEEYLALEAEIWPDTPLGADRLAEYKRNDLWTSLVARKGETIVGSLMVWREDEQGYVEDVFVRTAWRNRGVAKSLLTQALQVAKLNGLTAVRLMVLTTNQSALQLYESVGFHAEQEEIRYFLNLD